MPFLGPLIQGFDTRRKAYRDEQAAKAAADSDREFGILSALAQHTDPELAAIGAAGLLELAGGVKPAKGLRGFLGEMDRSTYLPQLKSLFASPSPPATPGAGALPGSSPVEPARQAGGPPSLGASPDGAISLPGAGAVDWRAPTPPPGVQTPLSAGGPPGLGQASPLLESELAGGGPLLGPPPGPPPPETPVTRHRRLFPTAAEIAGEQTYQQLAGKVRAIVEGLQRFPQFSSVIEGMGGAPQRTYKPELVEAEYETADGQRQTGTVVFDPERGQATAGGQPVRILRQVAKPGSRAPVQVRKANPDGTYRIVFINPETGAEVSTTQTGMPVPADPAAFQGGVTYMTKADGSTAAVRFTREGQPVEMPGYGPPPSRTPQRDPEAVGLLESVKQQLKALEAPEYPGGPRRPAPVTLADSETRRLTKDRYQSYAELVQAATPQARTSTPGGAPSMDDLANSVWQRLTRGRSDFVSGSGLPGGTPPAGPAPSRPQ